MRTRSLALATLAVTWLTTSAAIARPTPTCARAVVQPAGGNLPSDRVRLRYTPVDARPLHASPTPPRMYRLEGSTHVNVPYEIEIDAEGLWLSPITEQPLGTQLVVETPGCEEDAPVLSTYSITEKRNALPPAMHVAAQLDPRPAPAGSLDGGVGEPSTTTSCALASRTDASWLALLAFLLLRKRQNSPDTRAPQASLSGSMRATVTRTERAP